MLANDSLQVTQSCCLFKKLKLDTYPGSKHSVCMYPEANQSSAEDHVTGYPDSGLLVSIGGSCGLTGKKLV